MRCYSLGVGYSGLVDFGGGVSLKWLHQEVHDYESGGQVADIGFFVRFPARRRKEDSEANQRMKIRPELAVSWVYNGLVNSFDDWESWYFEGWYVGPGSQIGVSGEIQWGTSRHSWLSFMRVYESSYGDAQGRKTQRVGYQFGLADALFYRLGDQDIYSDDYRTTHGLTLSTRGLRGILGGQSGRGTVTETGFGRFLLDNLNLEFSWARISLSEYPRTNDHYQLDITL
jgi:hypothetical protein